MENLIIGILDVDGDIQTINFSSPLERIFEDAMGDGVSPTNEGWGEQAETLAELDWEEDEAVVEAIFILMVIQHPNFKPILKSGVLGKCGMVVSVIYNSAREEWTLTMNPHSMGNMQALEVLVIMCRCYELPMKHYINENNSIILVPKVKDYEELRDWVVGRERTKKYH